MTQECGDIRRLLSAWIDGELSGADQRRVGRHLEDCPDCRAEAETLGGLDAMLRADTEKGDPGQAYFATMGDRITARFDFDDASQRWARPEEARRKRGPAVARMWIPRFAFGIAGAAVAVIAFLLVHDLGTRPVIEPPPHVTDTMKESDAPQMAAARPVPPTASRASEPVQPMATPSTTHAAPKESPEPVLGMRLDVSRAIPNRVPEQAPPLTPEDGGAKVAYSLEAVPPVAITPTQDGSGIAPPTEAITPNRQELLAYFGAFVETGESPAGGGIGAVPSVRGAADLAKSIPPDSGPQDAAKRRSFPSPLYERSLRPAADAPEAGSDAARPSRSNLPDSTWVRQGRVEARALADSALAAGIPEGCKNALRAYWRMLHRDGRALFPDAAARARALEPDRLRIEDLLHCASR